MDCEKCVREMRLPHEAVALWRPATEDGYTYDTLIPLCAEHARVVTEGTKQKVHRGHVRT